MMPQQPVRLNTTRLDEEVTSNMPPFRPTRLTAIGWRSIGDHTVLIRQRQDRYGYRIWIADERGYYRRTITGDVIHASEEAALDAARQHLDSMNLLENDA